jgi:hypothetical protein
MTMSRKTKAGHLEVLASGQTPNFQSPTLIAKLRGRKQMSTKEYQEHRMGRHHGRVPAEGIRAGKAEAKIKAQRAAGRTRRV